MIEKIDRLTPEAQGLLRALSVLHRVRHFDGTGTELVDAGYAEFRKGALELTAAGKQRVTKAERKVLRARLRGE